MTTREWLSQAEARLWAAGVESARLEAQVLASHVLLVDRSWLLTHGETPFPDLAGESLVQRRESHEPLAYILGYREFFGRRFAVRPGVLIPRHETEVLVETALEHLPQRASVLDLGTGSGCIGITLKLERPDLEVTLSDKSERALAVARENAESLGSDVRIAHSAGFDGLSGEAFDRIVTNPPYIGDEESLMPEVAWHEPPEALFSGPTGLEFYEMLARLAPEYLADGGRVLMEVGYRQSESVRSVFDTVEWRHIGTARDLSGVERVLVFQVVHPCVPGT